MSTCVRNVIALTYHQLYSKLSHWKLRVLTEALLSIKSEELGLAKFREHVNFGTAEQRHTLIDAIKTYSDELNFRYPQDFILQKDSQPLQRRRKDPSYEIGVIASSLYQALNNRRTCTCKEIHDYAASIALATYWGCKDEQQKFDFDLILCLDLPQSNWKETHVTTSLAQSTERPSKVQFVLEEPNRSVKKTYKRFPPQRQRVNEICQTLIKALKSKRHRLNLELEDGELYKTQSTIARFTSDELTNFVSLRQLISSGTTSLGEKVKRVLAILLGYTVLHHFGGSWLGPSWGQDDVIFIKSASVILLRPYMLTRVVRTTTTEFIIPNQADGLDNVDPDDFPIHPYPDLVTLGTILLEIYTAKPIEALAAELGIEQEENVNARWSIAYEVYRKLQRDIPDNYSAAVNACLNPNFGSSANDMNGKEPLEDELDQGFGKSISVDDLDNVAKTMDFSSWGQILQRKVSEPLKSPLVAPLQPHSSESSILSHYPKDINHKKQKLPQLPASDFEMFDDSSGPANISESSCRLSEKWAEMLHKRYDSHIPEPGAKPKVRIAVLDTGVDLNHPDMNSERIQSVRSWVNGKNGEEEDRGGGDESGHGTHTAGILLDLAPDADIYLAQIATKKPSSPGQIAKAVTYAMEIWQVDTISMSFGFPNRVPGYADLEQAIHDAEHANILIFAAASNNGGNRQRAFPARTDKVICVHSSDGQGNPSDFNPTSVQNQDNFSTLGEAVRSSWPVGLCDLERNAEAIAAFLLAYARLNLSPAEAALLKRRAGMKAVLNLISESRKEYRYIALSMAPDSFFGKGKQFVRINMTQTINNS